MAGHREGYLPMLRWGVTTALADSSVRFVADSVDPQIWLDMGSRAGAEAIRGGL